MGHQQRKFASVEEAERWLDGKGCALGAMQGVSPRAIVRRDRLHPARPWVPKWEHIDVSSRIPKLGMWPIDGYLEDLPGGGARIRVYAGGALDSPDGGPKDAA